ncbi:ubiquinol-cytochrome c reductase iron-sulfur subunit [Salicibibacter halophilus]|uniref:Menaquinol:cytochrome c reductase iron-sulfur subunit n=2 Tax=Salicibibacter halophilus TaxID=2502791 RepID=A0A514LDN4_9BACI|nr:ubiquinol-cytochrome c reductase iron-sulfur subunit [Salicibibacter halophilus]
MMEKNHNVSRRQFLTYALLGTGGFMAAGLIMPMVRFGVDPILQADAEEDMIDVVSVDELTDVPQAFDMEYEQDHGWHVEQVQETVWIYLDGDEVVALSPVCTHLGCTVNWGTDPDNPEQFFCPCHFGRFERDGTNIPGTPPTEPLHRYDHEVRDGRVLLGNPSPQV